MFFGTKIGVQTAIVGKNWAHTLITSGSYSWQAGRQNIGKH